MPSVALIGPHEIGIVENFMYVFTGVKEGS
jgi:hypothetical protein